MANKARDAAEASALLRGEDPSTIPAVQLVKIGGVMLPAGPGLNATAPRSRLLKAWGMSHPNIDYDPNRRVPYSTDELLFIQRAINKAKTDEPAVGENNLASRVLHIIQSDPKAKPVFHPRHIADSARMRNGIESLRTLEKAGKPIAGRTNNRRKRQEEEEEEEEEEEYEDEEEEEEEAQDEETEEEEQEQEQEEYDDDDDEVDAVDDDEYEYDVQHEGQEEEAEWDGR